MNKLFKFVGIMCLALLFPIAANAQGDIIAEWNFEKNIPEGICDATNYEGKVADIPPTSTEYPCTLTQPTAN